MRKIFFTIFLSFITTIYVNASSYVGWQHIEVNSLPVASADTINYIYDFNNKYYVTKVGYSDYSSFDVNDKFNSSTFFYFFSDDLKTNLKNYLVDNNYIDSLHYYRVFDYSYGDYTFSLNFYYQNDKLYYSFYTSGLSQYTEYISFIDNNSFKLRLSNLGSDYYVITKIYNDFPSTVMFSSLPAVSYEWSEISYYDWYEFSSDSNDFYLFYNFTDISSFDILSWVDFTSFDDFQKLVVVIIVNILFCLLLLLFIYVFLKLFNKFVSWIFR